MSREGDDGIAIVWCRLRRPVWEDFDFPSGASDFSGRAATTFSFILGFSSSSSLLLPAAEECTMAVVATATAAAAKEALEIASTADNPAQYMRSLLVP